MQSTAGGRSNAGRPCLNFKKGDFHMPKLYYAAGISTTAKIKAAPAIKLEPGGRGGRNRKQSFPSRGGGPLEQIFLICPAAFEGGADCMTPRGYVSSKSTETPLNHSNRSATIGDGATRFDTQRPPQKRFFAFRKRVGILRSATNLSGTLRWKCSQSFWSWLITSRKRPAYR